jgi:alkylation response protein AidB-like acyl-CoA dehydrogenase
MASQAPETENQKNEDDNFVETALKLGGKSSDEVTKTGAIDRADDQMEDLFAKKYQTIGSPAHRAVWDNEFPTSQFQPKYTEASAKGQQVMDASIEVVKRRKKAGNFLNENKKIHDDTFQELADVGYWGLLVDEEHGGSGISFTSFARFLLKMSTIDATIGGLASVHGCIGAVDPLRGFGTPEQKKKFLPDLASGKRLSGFALTEPGAGSDLTALNTEAVLDGDDYVVNGEKLFITNAIPGRTVGLVCKVDGKPAVLITDLPEEENEHFQIVHYGLYALQHSYNNGLLFKDLRVPKENLLVPSKGDGLTIAYHGLNRGRVAVCAGSSGNMKAMLADMLPWSKYRNTYGQPIADRELVQRRIGLTAGLIVATEAMTDWCAWLLDEGYRGEMECIIAKIFGGDAQTRVAIDMHMKTHGGRAFVHGHMFGDYIHEFLAPSIYEGEGEILGLGFFKSLIKEHGKNFYEAIGKALYKAGINKPNMLNPMHAAKILPVTGPYIKWKAAQVFGGRKSAQLPNLPSGLAEQAQFAATALQKSRNDIDALMQKYQLGLADRQCAMADLSKRIQLMIVMLTTALWAGREGDEIQRQAALVLCQDLRQQITGKNATLREQATVVKLGKAIVEGGFKSIAGIEAEEILMQYK